MTAIGSLFWITFLSLGSSADAEPRTKAFINGVAAPVFFNDGDSFRVLSGRMKGTKARLIGFNTLESYGPVHQWGEWTAKELYVLAKEGTLLGRRGVWECSSELKLDTYGRSLMDCPSLADATVRGGLAHAMSVTANPADPRLLDAQREAIANRRGIWAKGVPEFVITSLHSMEERPDRPMAYNRLVSSEDGHSEKWEHQDTYQECERVCVMGVTMDSAVLERAAQAVATREAPTAAWHRLSLKKRAFVLRFFLMTESVSQALPAEERPRMRALLKELAAEGLLTAQETWESSCMTYVDFRRRFGGDKAVCLK